MPLWRWIKSRLWSAGHEVGAIDVGNTVSTRQSHRYPHLPRHQIEHLCDAGLAPRRVVLRVYVVAAGVASNVVGLNVQ